MQRVTFINQSGKKAVFGLTPPYILESVRGTGMLDAQLMLSDSVGYDGKSYQGSYIEDREVTVSIHIKGNTREDMYKKRMELMAILGLSHQANGEMGRLEYTNDYGTWWIRAVVRIGVQPQKRVANYNTSISLVFDAPVPYWNDMQPFGDRMAYLDGGLEFPLEIDVNNRVQFGLQGYQTTITNAGDAPAPVEIHITGPGTTPSIYKLNTDEFIKVNKSIDTGDELVIKTGYGNERRVTINRANGTSESAFGYLDLNSTFFLLDVGENRLEYRSGDDTKTAKIEITGYSQYGGV